jgi:hypothetical protein
MKRDQLKQKEIAEKRKVTIGFVSKSLSEANNRIEVLLQNTANGNKISLDVLNGEQGYARGKSHMFDVIAYITFSPKNGVQVWYEDKGDCIKCEKFAYCREVILQEFKERKIKFDSPLLQPTLLIERLIAEIEKRFEEE